MASFAGESTHRPPPRLTLVYYPVCTHAACFHFASIALYSVKYYVNCSGYFVRLRYVTLCWDRVGSGLSVSVLSLDCGLLGCDAV
jgi:hypothetical protein